MRNQIAAAERAGIRAVTINSTNADEWEPIQQAIRAGEVDVLLVSPERLNNPGFRDEVLPRLAATCGLLVVDEAHCISDWGHDFRPDYRRIRTLLDDLPEAHPGARDHRHRQRPGHRGRRRADGPSDRSDVLVLRGSLDRESLRLGVVRLRTPEQRLAWLADHLAEQPGSGIVYCLTVAATQEIADYLRSRGHDVAAYSGQTETTERQALEQDLVAGRVKALVATSALGMGFDATLGFVVLTSARRLRRSHTTSRSAAPGAAPPSHRGAAPGHRGPRHLGLLRLAGLPARGAGPAYLACCRGGPALPPRWRPTSTSTAPARRCSRCSTSTVPYAGSAAAGSHRQPWDYDEERYRRVTEAREREQQAMLDYLATDGCRMRFLRDQLDDPADAYCGRRQLRRLHAPRPRSAAAVEEAGARLARPGVPVEPWKMWPTALANLGSTSRARSPRAPRRAGLAGSPTSATATRSRTLFPPRPGTRTVPEPLARGPSSRCSGTGGRRRRHRRGRVPRPARP